jgi:hypothetical protein
MTGMSRRAYAKSRKIDESTVRKHLKAGTLTDAILPDGTIDPEKADALLRATRTRGRSVPVSLQAARSRRERALAFRDLTEVKKLESALVRPDEYAGWVTEGFSFMVDAIRALPARVAPRLVRQEPRDIHRILANAVNDLLNEMSSAFEQRAHDLQAQPDRSDPTPDLEAMTPTELATLRATTQARRVELELAMDYGVLRQSDRLLMIVGEALSVTKSRLLAISGRTAASIEIAPDADAVAALLTAEVEDIARVIDEPIARIRAMQPREAA